MPKPTKPKPIKNMPKMLIRATEYDALLLKHTKDQDIKAGAYLFQKGINKASKAK